MGSNDFIIGTGLWNNTIFGGGTQAPGPPPAPPQTVQDAILYRALRIAGILNNARRTPSTEELADAFQILNESIEGYGAERLLIYVVNRVLQPIVAGKQDYLIGDGAVFPDMNIPRPVRIENASLIYLQNGSQPIELPMQELTTQQWQVDVPLKAVQSTVPYQYWYETTFPFGVLHLWPYPQVDQEVALYLWRTITQFAAYTDTVALPTPYKEFVTYELALKLNEVWPSAVMKPESVVRAAEYRRRVKMMNRVVIDVDCDPAIVANSKYGYDWRTGSYRGKSQ